MKNTTETGKRGEELASLFLENKGWLILERNYRYKRGEIDLIALHDSLLIFLEVKFRKNNHFGHPENFVNAKKSEMVKQTAEYYLIEKNWKGNIRFDIIAISGGDMPEHFEDAF